MKSADDWVFVSHISLMRIPEGRRHIQQAPEDQYEYDGNRTGYWVKRDSPLMTMIILTGIEPYDYRLMGMTSGAWDRNGRIL